MKYTKLSTHEAFKQAVQHNASLVYFSSKACQVCHALKPKLLAKLEVDFPNMVCFEVNIDEAAELAAQLQVFTVPTVLVFFQGQEFIRKSRNLNIPAFANELARPYHLFFDK